MFQILYCKRTAQEVYECLTNSPNSPSYIMFRDASFGAPCYQISLSDCLNAIYKCHRLGFFNFEDFCVKEYERFEKVENGDLNWIIPGKFIAFCGPHRRSKIEDGMYYYKYNIHAAIKHMIVTEMGDMYMYIYSVNIESFIFLYFQVIHFIVQKHILHIFAVTM